MSIREFKVIFEQFWWSLKNKNYRYSFWKDNSVGFYLRNNEPEVYKEYLQKAHEKYLSENS